MGKNPLPGSVVNGKVRRCGNGAEGGVDGGGAVDEARRRGAGGAGVVPEEHKVPPMGQVHRGGAGTRSRDAVEHLTLGDRA